MKKTLCFIICVLLCVSLASCRKAEGGASSAPAGTGKPALKSEEISLLYYSGDSFNPYTAKTKHNRVIAHLIYDPLIKYDNEYNPVYCLAGSVSLAGNVCTVTLKPAYFTDKTPVTADDVVYSYNLARKSDMVYGAAPGSVIFSLKNADPYFLNLLDFPVIKAGSDKRKNSDGVEIAPIGSGRYYVASDGAALIRNDGYHGAIGEVSKINLINAPDETSVSHYVEVGAADMYYADESVQNIARMSGRRADVNTNNFVYIGINASYGQLSSSLVRYALSAAIDRTEICHSAYFDNATPATGFFNPVIKETSAVQSLKTVSDTQITVENLAKIGYNKLNNGYYCNEAGKHLAFSLLVNSDNPSRVAAAELIAAHCKAAGIEINVTGRGYGEYLAALASGSFQLYLGEIRVLPNVDLSNLVISGGSAAYGVGSAQTSEDAAQTAVTVCADMINRYKKGECALSDLAGAFLTEMPQIPVCYRKGMLFYTSRIKGDAKPSLCDIFFSFENYKFE